MKYIFPYIFAIIYWFVFFGVINNPSISLYAFLSFTLWCIASVIYIGRRRLWQQWNLWINYYILFVSSFFFVMILASPGVRNAYVVVSGLFSGFFMYAARKYFDHTPHLLASAYVNLIDFIFVLTFWQVIVLLYFMQILYNAPVGYGVFLAASAAFFLGRGIIVTHGLKKSSLQLVLVVLTLTTAELTFFLHLLPLHYYVLATIVTSWFYYVLQIVLAGQEVASRKRIFRLYTTTLASVIIVLLMTARWD